MSPVLKILVGALMMVLGVFASITYSTQLIELVLGAIGPLLLLVGAFIVWLESDELRVSREEKRGSKQREFEGQQTLQEETKPEQQTREAAREIKQAVKSEKPDPEEILEGTVDEVRQEVQERDDIDVEELLEAEKQGQNRKTLVNYLERRVD